MGIFSNIDLEWGGEVYTIPSDQVMKAIAVLESHITVPEFLMIGAGRTMPVSRLCMAYGALLRYAGAKVADDEVYQAVFTGGDLQGQVLRSVNEIMTLIIPPAAREKLEAAGEESSPDMPLGNSPATTAALSSKPTKRRSQAAGG